MGIGVEKKPWLCQVCQHPQVDEINRALLQPKASTRKLSLIFGPHYKAIERHRASHLPKAIAEYAAQQATAVFEAEISETTTLNERTEALMARAQQIMEAAEKRKDYGSALKGIREMRACLELLAKLAGEIDQGATVNVFNMPSWITLQTGIIMALEPYPEARAAVLRALPAS